MLRRFIPAALLLVYGALLVRLLIFKDASFKIGHLMLNFSGYASGSANLIPFKTILPYLLGEKGLMIALFNIGGNIVLLVPVGFLAPQVYRSMTWGNALVLAVMVPLIIESTQALFRIGIFDIDDVLLNGLGVLVGYGLFLALTRWVLPLFSSS